MTTFSSSATSMRAATAIASSPSRWSSRSPACSSASRSRRAQSGRVDDPPEKYVDGFKGSEYGRTPLRDLLHLSSGVDFGEERDGGPDLSRLWAGMVAGRSGRGTIASITQFNKRIAPPGRRFHYASIEPDVLAVVLRYATKKSMSDYLQEKIWQPIGAQSDAPWLVDAQGFNLAHFGFSAVLRDYARLGRLLAHDGAWNGRQMLPKQWMLDATTVRASDPYLTPDRKSTRLNSSHLGISYAVFCLKKKKKKNIQICHKKKTKQKSKKKK